VGYLSTRQPSGVSSNSRKNSFSLSRYGLRLNEGTGKYVNMAVSYSGGKMVKSETTNDHAVVLSHIIHFQVVFIFRGF
jgi:hypothetical protein